MNYRLLYDTGNGYEDLDLGDDAPAMNYQICNLNELKDRQAIYSQAIKLPKTPNNLRLLGFLDSSAIVADAAYTPQRCQLLCEGARLSPFGALLYVDSIDEEDGGSIECQIVSDTVDLFSALGEVDNMSMVAPEWEGLWTSEQILSDNADKDGTKRWPVLFTQQGQTPSSPFPNGLIYVYEMVPCYRFITMVEQMFREFGYQLESDLLDDPYMQSLYITASKISEECCVTASYTGTRGYVPTFNRGNSYLDSSVKLHDVYQSDLFGDSVLVANEAEGHRQWNQWQYHVVQPGDYTLFISIYNSGRFPLDDARRIRVDAFVWAAGKEKKLLSRESYPDHSIYPEQTWYIEYDVTGLNPKDIIKFQVLIYNHDDTGRYTTIEVSAYVALIDQESKPGVGSYFQYARATDFKNYKELVQTFMQLFGVLVEMAPAQTASDDGIIGTVRMYTFQELYRRRDAGIYVDWSDKLVIDNERTIGFKLGSYAQNNIIQLTDNTDEGTRDAGSFSINNRTLESEKTLFTIAAEAGRNITYKNQPLAVVPTIDPQIETDDNGVATSNPVYKGCKAHLVRIDEENKYKMNLYRGYETYGTYFPIAQTVTMQELINRYYAPVKRLTSHARTISAYFNLTTLDIEQLDLFTPVWIAQQGCFFYISKINNFVAGQLTKVELVKMTSYEEKPKYYITLDGRNADIATAVPANTSKIRVAYRTNGTLHFDFSGDDVVASCHTNEGYIIMETQTNESYESRVGTVRLSVEEDPLVERKITITQNGAYDPTKLYIELTTNGTELYVSTSRPLKSGEYVVVMSRGSGRMALTDFNSGKRTYWKSKKRWHIPNYAFTVAESGKIIIPAQSDGNTYRWRLFTDPKGTFVHIKKANRSRNFGYKVTGDMDKAVTFAVAVVGPGSKPYFPREVSNRCYFESRAHIRDGALTQEFVVTQ